MLAVRINIGMISGAEYNFYKSSLYCKRFISSLQLLPQRFLSPEPTSLKYFLFDP
jgi:hypothetical protein